MDDPALWAAGTVLVAGLLAAGAAADWRARRRVRPVQAHDVTPAQIRYVSARQEDQR